MTIDLSSLENAFNTPDSAPAPTLPSGEPLRIAIDLIDEDPAQPRTEFAADAMDEMAASIKARGVKAPVSVRKHPDDAGRYILNFGARRLRGSKLAGLAEIPAFLDEAHTDYDQVIENEQRENLTPMELALFIARKLAAGEKKAGIAKKLGKPAEVVTRHMALIDMPACIEEVYSSGKSRSAQTLYALRQLHDKHPDEVQTWVADTAEVTRAAVDALAAQLKGGKPKSATDSSKTLAHEQGKNEAGESDKTGAANTEGAKSGANQRTDDAALAGGSTGNLDGTAEDPGVDTGEMTSWPKGKAVSDPNLMKKPLLLVEYAGRAAALLLNRRPGADSLVWIRYEDNGGDDQVDAAALKINRLMEE